MIVLPATPTKTTVLPQVLDAEVENVADAMRHTEDPYALTILRGTVTQLERVAHSLRTGEPL